MTVNIAIIIISIYFIHFFSNRALNTAIAFSKAIDVPIYIISATVIAFATSLPEFLISGFSAYKGDIIIAYSNNIGSNIFNSYIIYAIFGLLFYIKSKESDTFNIHIINTLLLVITAIGYLFLIDYLNGIFLIIIMITISSSVVSIFSYKIYSNIASNTSNSLKKGDGSAFLLNIIVSLIGLIIASKVFLDYSVAALRAMEVRDVIIGNFFTAVGTSMPEISLSLISLFRSAQGFIIGDAIGSNIFNIIFGFSIALISSGMEFQTNSDIIHSANIFMVSGIIFYICILYSVSSNSKYLMNMLGVTMFIMYFLFIYLL